MSRVFNNVAASSPNRIGAITWQYTLLPNHLKLTGGEISNFSVQYDELLNFFESNNLLASTIEIYNTNTALGYYDETEDKMTMPNFIDKTIWGGNGEVSVKEAGLPNIIASGMNCESVYKDILSNTSVPNGAIRTYAKGGPNWGKSSGSSHGYWYWDFNASRCSAIYGKSSTVQPPAITLIPQIRFAMDSNANIGEIRGFVAATSPNGYLSCDGSIYDISIYQDLADFILDQFGSYNHFGGDGITTFGVPNLNTQSSPMLNCIKY